MTEMKISNTLVNDTSDKTIAYAEQLKQQIINWAEYNHVTEKLGPNNRPNTQNLLNNLFLRVYEEFLTFLNNADATDQAINTWKEIEAFLAGYTDDKTLASIVAQLNANIESRLNVQLADETGDSTITGMTQKAITDAIDGISFSTGEQVKEVGIDNEPTAGSDNLVRSGGVQNELALGAIYDVSAKNPTAGSNNDGKFESLSALLSDANLNTLIPTAYRKGGMSIKYVQSSDNKYVQDMLMADSFTTDVTQWQRIRSVDDLENFTKNGKVEFEISTDKTIPCSILNGDMAVSIKNISADGWFTIEFLSGETVKYTTSPFLASAGETTTKRGVIPELCDSVRVTNSNDRQCVVEIIYNTVIDELAKHEEKIADVNEELTKAKVVSFTSPQRFFSVYRNIHPSDTLLIKITSNVRCVLSAWRSDGTYVTQTQKLYKDTINTYTFDEEFVRFTVYNELADAGFNGVYTFNSPLSDSSFNTSVIDFIAQQNDINDTTLDSLIDTKYGKVDKRLGNNLVNPDTLFVDYYINLDGRVLAASAQGVYTVSDYIHVTSDVISNGSTTVVFGCINVYDSSLELKRTISGTNQYTYQAGDAYIRIMWENGSNTKMANFGTTLLPYEAYIDNRVPQYEERFEEIEDDICYKTGTKDNVKNIGSADFTTAGVLDSSGKFKDNQSGFLSYRVTGFIAIDDAEYIDAVKVITISGFSGIAFYTQEDENTFVGGGLEGTYKTFDYPTARYVRFTSFWGTEGSAEFYNMIIDTELVKDRLSNFIGHFNNIVTVDINGHGDYTSLETALADIHETQTAPVTIIVMPGEYEMSEWNDSYWPDNSNYRNINIIGINKHQCILYNTKAGYNADAPAGVERFDNAPLKIGGNCLIKNLTIKATSEDFDVEKYGALYKRAYCIHLDRLVHEGDVMQIDNCILINDHFSCIGCGQKKGYTIKVTNCEFYHTSAYTSWDWAAAFYMHDGANLTNALTQVKDCKIKSNAVGIYADCGIGHNEITLEFINNVVKADTAAYMYREDAVLNEFCYGNNDNSMNYTA